MHYFASANYIKYQLCGRFVKMQKMLKGVDTFFLGWPFIKVYLL